MLTKEEIEHRKEQQRMENEAHENHLRLECLKLAVSPERDTNDVVTEAKAFAAFVLGGE